jgi:AcrR family transcriptional regulator
MSSRRAATLVAPVLQDRSAETQARLIRAAQALLSARPPHAITIQDVAAAAGTSVGIVYRRFADKDALFETAFVHHFADRTRRRNDMLAKMTSRKAPLMETVRSVIESLTAEDRRYRGFLQSYLLFVASTSPATRKRLERVNADAFEAVIGFLGEAAARERTPHDEARVRFAVTLIAHALRSMVVLEQHSLPTRLALTDRELVDNLTRATVAYLHA